MVDRQVKREQQRIRRPEAWTADDANNNTGIFKNIQDVYSGIVGLGSLLGFGSLAENTRANASTRADDDIDDQLFNNSGKSNSGVDEQISLNDDSNSLLRVRSQQGLTRWANLFITTLTFIIVNLLTEHLLLSLHRLSLTLSRTPSHHCSVSRSKSILFTLDVDQEAQQDEKMLSGNTSLPSSSLQHNLIQLY